LEDIMSNPRIAIVGAGPAGLSAAIYTGRSGIETTVLGCAPKIAGDYEVDNYFGFPTTVTGRELIERGQEQAKRFGARISCDRVLGVHMDENGGFELKTEKDTVSAGAVILATGVSRVRPGIANLQDYEGKGVSYCVSCDGFFYRNKQVLVLGEGVYAANQALELRNYTPNVAICTQGKEPSITPEFRARLDEAGLPIIEKRIQTLAGANGLERVRYADGGEAPVDGLFIALGEASALDFAYSLGLLREGVFIKVDEEQRTNIPGVFAAGDCTGGYLQIAVAVGEGAKAARAALGHVKGK
jgi:thioredoxin reductase (NADPH)